MMVFRLIPLGVFFCFCLGMKLSADDFSQVVQANNNLGMKVFKQKLALKDASMKNITVSLVSMTTVVLSLALGSADETREELMSLLSSEDVGLGKPLPKVDVLWGDWGLLSKQIKADNQGYIHDLGFFYDKRMPLLDSYSELISKSTAVQLMPLLSLKRDAVVNQLNAWVKRQTKGNMLDLMSPAMVLPESTLFGIDVAMFQGEWLAPFDPSSTEQASFFQAKGVAAQVGDFMCDSCCEEFVIKDEFQLVWRGYKDSSVLMMIVLPVGKDTPEDLLAKSSLAEWLRVRREREAVLSAKDYHAKMEDMAHFFLPRFKILSPSVDLKAIFQGIGARLCFDPDLADFSLMSNAGIRINSIYQKTILQVDERGTLAVGASEMGGDPFGGGMKTIRANRPFFFLLVDQKTDLVLFMSVLRAPFPARKKQ